MYRHRIVKPTYRDTRLADLAAEASAMLTNLPFVPQVNFFVPDPNGSYERDQRVVGFIDHRSSAERCDVFVLAGRSPSETAQTIFHESRHIEQFATGRWQTLSHERREAEAEDFARFAPVRSGDRDNWASVCGEIAWKLSKDAIRRGDLQRARFFCTQRACVNEPAAWKIQSEIWSCGR